jgi:hypothetical protein
MQSMAEVSTAHAVAQSVGSEKTSDGVVESFSKLNKTEGAKDNANTGDADPECDYAVDDEIDAIYTWREGDDPRDVWLITDQKQLAEIPLPDANKLPCEALATTIRAFVKRGLKITKLALAWWLTFNVQELHQVEDLISIEEAIDVGIKARVPQILMILAEYSTPELMNARRETIMQWYAEARTGTGKFDRQKAAHLGATLVEMGWLAPDAPAMQPTTTTTTITTTAPESTILPHK